MNIILDATTKSIVATMSGVAATTNPDFTAAYADNNGTVFTEGANDGALNGTNSVTLVAAPAASTRRTIKSITIENKDTAAVTLTISYNNNSTLRTLYKVTLNVGDTWTTDGTFDTFGSLKGTGYGTMSQQNANAVVITGGTINAVTIDSSTLTNANISATTSANATFATSSLPLVPEGYITISINGTNKKIPYYGV
jgi:hypothetical protein